MRVSALVLPAKECGVSRGFALISARLGIGLASVLIAHAALAFSGPFQMAGGGAHTVALKSDGTVWTWGNNANGQLGDNTTTDRHTPVQVLGPGGSGFLTGVTAIAAGSAHTVALKSDGTVWTWGSNSNGQLGDNTTTDRSTPVQVLGPGGSGVLTGVTAIAAGNGHTVALKSDGTVWAWGYNANGQLGDNTTTDRHTPVQVLGPGGSGFLTGVTAIAAGLAHTVVLKSDGTVWAWGHNAYGELGDNTTTDRHTPVQVLGPGGSGVLTGVRAIAAGGFHTVALKSDGTVWAWGYNANGQLGDNTGTDRHTPVQVLGPGAYGFLAGVAAIAAGNGDTVALKSDGTVWAWGSNSFEQLGDNTGTDRHTPVQVMGPGGSGFLTGATAIAAGDLQTVALEPDGTVWAWGYNAYGQLGDNTTTDRATPVQVLGAGGSGVFNVRVRLARDDFNADGKSDVLWRNVTSGDDYVFLMNGAAVAAASDYTNAVPDQAWQVVGVGDFDGDSKTDILWRNSSTGEDYIFLMDGTTVKAGSGYTNTVGAPWQVAGVGDFDGDGKADILWRNSATGEDYIFFMDGTTVKASSGYTNAVPDLNWQVAGVGDFDGDGKADILWRDSSTAADYLFFMNGLAVKAASGYTFTVPGADWKVAGVGDYDGDGEADILWRNSSTGEDYIFLMDRLAVKAGSGYTNSVPDVNWQIVGTGDYDGDGKSDILWRNASTGADYVFLMNGEAVQAGSGYTNSVTDLNWHVQNP